MVGGVSSSQEATLKLPPDLTQTIKTDFQKGIYGLLKDLPLL